jgi:hypothetical protein
MYFNEIDYPVIGTIYLACITVGNRCPSLRPPVHANFNYILRMLFMGYQCKELAIERDQEGRFEIHYTRIFARHSVCS